MAFELDSVVLGGKSRSVHPRHGSSFSCFTFQGALASTVLWGEMGSVGPPEGARAGETSLAAFVDEGGGQGIWRSLCSLL